MATIQGRFSSAYTTGGGNTLALGFLNGVAYDFTTVSSSLYLGMLTDQANEVEITGGTYTRQLITFDTVLTGNNGSANSNAISFTGLPAANVDGWCIYSHASNAETGLWVWENYSGASPATLVLSDGDTVNQAIGTVNIQFS